MLDLLPKFTILLLPKSYTVIGVTMTICLLSIIIITSGRSNIILILIALELILLSAQLIFIFYSILWGDILGQLYALLVLTVAAGESAIGLALIILYYRLRGSVTLAFIDKIKA